VFLQECREQPRRLPHEDPFCRLLVAVGGVAGPAAVQHLSPAGIGLVVNRRFEPGTTLRVELIHPGKNLSRKLLLRVVHAHHQNDGAWSVGFSFVSPVSREELEALV
jgi:hypothetical protein